MRWIWIVACIGALGVTNAAATVFRCAGADGEVLFTDVACPNGLPQPTHELNSYAGAVAERSATSPESRAPTSGTHERSGMRTRRTVAGAVEPSRTFARTAIDADAAAARRCAVARDRLDAVRATMRRGYKAASAGRLAARLHDARAKVERDCGG